MTAGADSANPGRQKPRTLNGAARRLLDGANFAHLSTLQPDGAPKAEPVWVLREGDFILTTSDAKSLKARNIAADPRVALSVVDYHNPYEQLLVRGRVVETRGDPELAVLDTMARKYLGVDFPRRQWAQRLVFVIEADTVRPYSSPLIDPRAHAHEEERP
jgi:PPOX class probable F420-dependent enzyme